MHAAFRLRTPVPLSFSKASSVWAALCSKPCGVSRFAAKTRFLAHVCRVGCAAGLHVTFFKGNMLQHCAGLAEHAKHEKKLVAE